MPHTSRVTSMSKAEKHLQILVHSSVPWFSWLSPAQSDSMETVARRMHESWLENVPWVSWLLFSELNLHLWRGFPVAMFEYRRVNGWKYSNNFNKNAVQCVDLNPGHLKSRCIQGECHFFQWIFLAMPIPFDYITPHISHVSIVKRWKEEIQGNRLRWIWRKNSVSLQYHIYLYIYMYVCFLGLHEMAFHVSNQ